MPEMTIPAMFTPSWVADPTISLRSQKASPSARLPAAGTVVTLMKTPTIVAVFSIASASAPAAPAIRATMNDHLSGCQMKPVFGRGRVTSSTVIIPAIRATSASTVTTAMANAKDSTRSRRLRAASPQRASTIPAATPATAAYSGPTTIAPTTRIEESVITAIAASITASTRKIRYDRVATEPASAWASTDSQITASSGCPGAAASSRRASANGVPAGVSIRIAPRSSSSMSSSVRSRPRPAPGRRRTRRGRRAAGARRRAAPSRWWCTRGRAGGRVRRR